MKHILTVLFIITTLTFRVEAEPSISPSLYFNIAGNTSLNKNSTSKITSHPASVTIRFSATPSLELISRLENNGLLFKRYNGEIMHTRHIYLAHLDPNYLEELKSFPEIERIENTARPAMISTLEVSNPQVQASKVWDIPHEFSPLDGSGVTIANFDTGIDIFHPGFFFPDGGNFNWIDFNNSGAFESGIDYVDLNNNNTRDSNEILAFFDAAFSDPLNLVERKTGVYDADIDWLYNDANRNGDRDFGPDAGFKEDDPSYGELFFVIDDLNENNRLDPGENITALGTSKITAVLDINGEHYRGNNLFTVSGDTINHGSGSSGIVGGQLPGRRFTGMAPGVEFIEINYQDNEIEDAMIWAKNMKADIFMYEFATYVYEFLDGSSNFEIMINDMYDEGIHQITASGNLAGPARKKHARLELERSETDTLKLSVPEIGIKHIFSSLLWKNEFLSPTIILVNENGDSVPINGDTKERTLGDVSIVSGNDMSAKNTYRMDILIQSDNDLKGEYYLLITNRRSMGIRIDGYIADDQTHWMNGVQFNSHVTDDGTVCSPGTAEKGITVGAYDPRGTRNEKGNINDFSSWGNTTDGRRAVDITAPGTLVYSLTSHYAVGGNPGGYIDFGGTSAALPHVVGCAALILQAHPEYSPDKLSQVILDGAKVDTFTGDVPNNIWGYGKLRVYDSLYLNNDIVNIEKESTPLAFNVSEAYPNPFNSSVTFAIKTSISSKSPLNFNVYNLLGQNIFSRSIHQGSNTSLKVLWNGQTNNGSTASSGNYIFTFNSGNNTLSRTALFLK